jgi:hypothetical protein
LEDRSASSRKEDKLSSFVPTEIVHPIFGDNTGIIEVENTVTTREGLEAVNNLIKCDLLGVN